MQNILIEAFEEYMNSGRDNGDRLEIFKEGWNAAMRYRAKEDKWLEDFIASQVEICPEMAKVLDEHSWELYESDAPNLKVTGAPRTDNGEGNDD